MKKSINLLLLVLLMALFYGCPITSEYAIDTPSVKVDKSFFGLWEQRTINSDDKRTYRVSKKDEHSYKITENIGPGEEDTIGYIGHISKIGNTAFLNCKFITFYSLYKFDEEENKVILTEIQDDSTIRFTNSTQVKKYITQNMAKSNFYGEKLTYLKR